MRMLRRTDPWFSEFGEVYFSTVYPGVVKGWHLHERMELNYACVVGTVRLVLHDARPGSPTRGLTMVVHIGERNYALVKIPPGIWNGFKNIGLVEAVVANCASMPHDPAEIRRLPPHGDGQIPYDWTTRDG